MPNSYPKLPSDLENGVVETIKILNEKGYITICSCEGHIYSLDNLWDKNYSPIWIVFESPECTPKQPPSIEGYKDVLEGNVWRNRHSGYYLGGYKATKNSPIQYGLWVGFDFRKREIKKRSSGDIHKEHERVLKELETWAREELKERND